MKKITITIVETTVMKIRKLTLGKDDTDRKNDANYVTENNQDDTNNDNNSNVDDRDVEIDNTQDDEYNDRNND